MGLDTWLEGEDDKVCEKYRISKEKWTQFCQSRREPSWQVSWFSLFLNHHIYVLLSTYCYVLLSQDVRKKAQAIQKQNTTPHVLSRGGYDFLENNLMEHKQKKWLDEASQSGITDTAIDPPSPIRRHVKWKMTHTKKTSQMTSEVAKEIADTIVSHFHLSVVNFYNNFFMSKPILFFQLTTRFLGGAGLTGKLFCPWTSGCIECFHWVTKAPWLCPCCWSRCDNQTLFWIGFKGLLHLFIHGC